MSAILSRPVEVLLVDDHALFAEGLANVLAGQEGVRNVSICTSGENALVDISAAGKDQRFDVILLDLGLPDISGSDLIKSLRARGNHIPVVVISGTDNEQDVQQAFDSGACGFVPKSSSSQIVIDSITAAINGDTYLPEALYERVNPYSSRLHDDASNIKTVNGISARQIEVLVLLDRGYSNARIAKILDISVATVKSHLIVLYRALNCNNRTECVRVARDLKLID